MYFKFVQVILCKCAFLSGVSFIPQVKNYTSNNRLALCSFPGHSLINYLSAANRGKYMSELIENLPEVNFEETESQKMVAEMVREFGARKIKPKMMEWDESQEFPI